MKIGEKFKKIRSELKLTQEDFAHKIGISRSNLGQIEIGKSNPTYETIGLLCSIFDIDANSIYNESEIVNLFVSKNDNKIYNTNDNKSEKTSVGTHELDENSRGVEKEKFDNLKALKENYEKRLTSELSLYNVELFNQLELKEKAHELSEMIWFMIGSYINNKPTPFETWMNRDFSSGKLNIPDSLDYEAYKKTIIEWLDDSKHFDEAIPSFLELSGKFLSTMREIIDKQKKEA